MTPNDPNSSPWGESKPDAERAVPQPAVPQPVAPAPGQTARPIRRKPHPWMGLLSLLLILFYGLRLWYSHAQNVGIRHYNAGLVAENKGDAQGAIREFSLATDSAMKDSDKADAYFRRGYLLLHAHQNDKAIADFSKTIELNGNYEEAYFNRALVEIRIGQLSQASSDFDRAFQLKPDDKDIAPQRARILGLEHYNAGLAAEKKGDAQTAISEFSLVVAADSHMTDSDKADSYFRRGYLLFNAHQNDKALADFSKTIELNDTYEEAYFNRGLIEIDKGQLSQASSDFDRVVQLKPDDKNVAAERERIRQLQNAHSSAK